MCGIAGWIAYNHDLTTDPTVHTMTDTMACRGPDASTTWRAPHAALGHRRLAILDLDHGDQPMIWDTPDGPVVLIYTGETYNYQELRRDLSRRGHRFHTTSDTEVVLHAYLEWGPAMVERLNGMYAFAVWDARDETLMLVRDRMGVKPLYIHPTPDGVLFGSEPKAILAHPHVEPVVSLDGFRELFSMVKSPRQTIWDTITEVEPGTLCLVNRVGIREQRYWKLETTPHTDSQHDTVERVRELLGDTVPRQLVADVPLCSLLSGGLDSSSMTAIAAQSAHQRGSKLRTFSVDFVNQTERFTPDELRPLPDTPFAREVAAFSGTNHTEVVLSPADLADPTLREQVIRAYDLPISHGDMDLSLYLLFAAIRQHSTVALCGESADELFGGYHQFFSPTVRAAHTFPWLSGPHLPQYAAIDPKRPPVFTPEFDQALELPAYVHASYNQAVAAIDRLGGEGNLEWTMRRISNLYLTRFLRILLDRQDRLSMAVGLEIRVPFCDHRLVSYVYNTPWAIKTYDGREKSLLRGAMADALPRSVVERIKSPYPSTQDPGYAAALQTQARDLLAERDHPVFALVNQRELARAAHAPAETHMYGRFIMERALDLALWLDMYQPTLKLG